MKTLLKKNSVTRVLLWIGAGFFLFEFVLHFFGISILEHDEIFIFTHDRYVAMYALSLAVLFILVSTNFRKYYTLFLVTMLLALGGIIVANIIAAEGGYSVLFPAVTLDEDLIVLGAGFYLWYFLTWITWYYHR